MTPDEVRAEARRIQRADLERARSALQAANACGAIGGVTYRIARVELDDAPPLTMIVDVRASDLDGPRLPHLPEPDDVYVPPEDRGAPQPVRAVRLEPKVAVTEAGWEPDSTGWLIDPAELPCSECGQITYPTRYDCACSQ